ncbi:DUF6975 family protein [Sphingomicrobium lutaoense]|uniref:Uncharacterized protein n=1 Tax=Sphingomicrobium lutaoense TaxID=515949 RepID=A0A839YXF0_9SPHN|nr:hypothetical protein [Sphingomicrobium lutaoense]MBB3763716.1 hypothetical protein [Sphingomicrobium lutaoense]
MAGNAAVDQSAPGVADTQLARIAADGSRVHDHALHLQAADGPSAARDLADAVHLLCSIYGRHPGMIELALATTPAGPIREWMMGAADAFERERLFLVRLTAAVGPLPSTPGAHETEAVLRAQRRAVETLAQSERQGCALGAATALTGDWPVIRAILDRCAARVGVDAPESILPGDDDSAALIREHIVGPGPERALAFGAEQLLLQHRGLFDLLEARAGARDKADGIG